MKLKTLVITVSLIQAVLDGFGIAITLNFTTILSAIFHETQNLSDGKTEIDISNQDLREVGRVNLLYYTLPFLFSGVIPRMLNGFGCMISDQLVADRLYEMERVLSLRASSSKGSKESQALWNTMVNETSIKLNHSLEKRKVACHASNYVITPFSLLSPFELRAVSMVKEKKSGQSSKARTPRQGEKTSTTTVVGEGGELPVVLKNSTEYMEFHHRLEKAENLRAAEVMRFFELGTMALNALASLLVAFVVLTKLKFPLLHLPWLLLSAVEISGNSCVAMAFIIIPGFCQLTSLICAAKVLWLGLVWSKAISVGAEELW